jgi:hypothetical protein
VPPTAPRAQLSRSLAGWRGGADPQRCVLLRTQQHVAPRRRCSTAQSASSKSLALRLSTAAAARPALSARAGSRRHSWWSTQELDVEQAGGAPSRPPGGTWRTGPCRRELGRQVAAVRLAQDGRGGAAQGRCDCWFSPNFGFPLNPHSCNNCLKWARQSPARHPQPKKKRGDCRENISLQSPVITSERHMCR